jgi:hypothetical protein
VGGISKGARITPVRPMGVKAGPGPAL